MECPKNHIEHYTVLDNDGTVISKGARLHLVHHKNERKDGHLILPLADSIVDVLDMMEKASKHLAQDCPTIFMKPSKRLPFDDAYFSQYCTSALSFGNRTSTATNMRHEFASWFRDFNSSQAASNNMQDDLEEAAATMMGNKPPSWDAAYDDKARIRPMEKVLAVYPAFKAWVMNEYATKRQQVPRDPHA